MQYVSRGPRWAFNSDGEVVLDLDNHVVKERSRNRELVSWCGQVFGTLPDGDVSEMTPTDFSRLCKRCTAAVKAATGFTPKFEGQITVW